MVSTYEDDSGLCFSTHLNSCRYVKPKHVDVADFLQEVTTTEGVQFLKPDHKHFTVEEFVRAYMASDMYKDVLRIVNNQEVSHINCS